MKKKTTPDLEDDLRPEYEHELDEPLKRTEATVAEHETIATSVEI
jgi:hypothetical protein